MRLWPAFEVHQEELPTFDSLDWRQFSGICVSLLTSIDVLRAPYGEVPESLPSSPGLGL